MDFGQLASLSNPVLAFLVKQTAGTLSSDSLSFRDWFGLLEDLGYQDDPEVEAKKKDIQEEVRAGLCRTAATVSELLHTWQALDRKDTECRSAVLDRLRALLKNESPLTALVGWSAVWEVADPGSREGDEALDQMVVLLRRAEDGCPDDRPLRAHIGQVPLVAAWLRLGEIEDWSVTWDFLLRQVFSRPSSGSELFSALLKIFVRLSQDDSRRIRVRKLLVENGQFSDWMDTAETLGGRILEYPSLLRDCRKGLLRTAHFDVLMGTLEDGAGLTPGYCRGDSKVESHPIQVIPSFFRRALGLDEQRLLAAARQRHGFHVLNLLWLIKYLQVQNRGGIEGWRDLMKAGLESSNSRRLLAGLYYLCRPFFVQVQDYLDFFDALLDAAWDDPKDLAWLWLMVSEMSWSNDQLEKIQREVERIRQIVLDRLEDLADEPEQELQISFTALLFAFEAVSWDRSRRRLLPYQDVLQVIIIRPVSEDVQQRLADRLVRGFGHRSEFMPRLVRHDHPLLRRAAIAYLTELDARSSAGDPDNGESGTDGPAD